MAAAPPCRHSLFASSRFSPGAIASRARRCVPIFLRASSARSSCCRRPWRTPRSRACRRNTASTARCFPSPSPRCGARRGTRYRAPPTRSRWPCSRRSPRWRRPEAPTTSASCSRSRCSSASWRSRWGSRASERSSTSSRTRSSSGSRRGRACSSSPRNSRNFTGVPVPSGAGFFESLRTFVRYAASADPWIFATGALTLVAAIAAKRWLPRIPYMIVGLVAGSLFGYALASTGVRSGADGRRTAVGVACIFAAVIRSRRMAQARAGGARADGARSRPGSIGRARRRREIGAADRQQPGIHRPGPVQPGRRVHVGLYVVGLVQPDLGQLRCRRAHTARRGLLGASSSSSSSLASRRWSRTSRWPRWRRCCSSSRGA